MRSWSVISAGEDQTGELGRCIGLDLEQPLLILLRGDLGVGKTVFARGIARGLGVAEAIPVTSPTFTLMNHYPARLDLYHFDLYRLSGAEDLLDIGFDEYAFGRGIALVEWPEKIEDPDICGLWIDIVRLDECHRSLTFSCTDPHLSEVLDRLQRRLFAAGITIEKSP